MTVRGGATLGMVEGDEFRRDPRITITSVRNSHSDLSQLDTSPRDGAKRK